MGSSGDGAGHDHRGVPLGQQGSQGVYIPDPARVSGRLFGGGD